MWKLGNVSLQETEVWKNLGKVWHSDINCKLSVQNFVQKGFEAISRMARLDCRSSALNPKNFAQLWKSIALPHMLYGCELWYLNKQHIRELEKVQNVFSKTVQSLLPGTSSSAARGLLGLNSIETEINKKKLYLLGRMINSDSRLVHKKLLVRRLVKWKWSKKKMTGFNPDVIKVLREYDLLGFIVDYLKNESFPSKNRWKTIAKRATHEKDQQDWISRIHQKTGLQLYFASLPVLEVSKWYQVWNYSSMHSRQIIDVVRLICVSLTIKNNRLGNDGTLTRICPACDCSFTNPVHHALLFCKETERAREDW